MVVQYSYKKKKCNQKELYKYILEKDLIYYLFKRRNSRYISCGEVKFCRIYFFQYLKKFKKNHLRPFVEENCFNSVGTRWAFAPLVDGRTVLWYES